MTDTELALEICREIRSAHKKICLPYKLEPGDPGLTDSKADGVPYFPKDEPWPKDARRNRVILTEQGADAVEGCRKVFRRVAARMMDGFSQEELAQLAQFQRRMLDNLNSREKE